MVILAFKTQKDIPDINNFTRINNTHQAFFIKKSPKNLMEADGKRKWQDSTEKDL